MNSKKKLTCRHVGYTCRQWRSLRWASFAWTETHWKRTKLIFPPKDRWEKNRRRVFSISCLLVWWLPNSVVALSSSHENENLLHAQDDLLEAVVLACNGNSRKSLTRCRKVIKVTCLYFLPRRREKCVAISWSRFRQVWKSELNIHYVFLLLLWFRNVAITTTLVSKSKLLWTRLPQTNILCHTWAFVWRSLLIFKPC